MDYNFGSLKGFFDTAMKYVFPSTYEDADAQKLLNEWPRAGAWAAGADCGAG